MVQAVFFDLDGTLINTEIIWVKATWQVLAQDYQLPISYEETKETVYGRAWNDIFMHLNERFPNRCGKIEEMEVLVERAFRQLTQNGVPAIPGSVETLKALSEQGKIIAIVSGSPRKMIEEAINNLQIADHVHFYLGSEDYSPGKPSPNCFLKAQQQANVPHEYCLVIEDSNAGLRAAQAAGIRSVAIQCPDNTQDLSMATFISNNLVTFDFDQL